MGRVAGGGSASPAGFSPSRPRPRPLSAAAGWLWLWLWLCLASGRLEAVLADAPAWEMLSPAGSEGPAARAWHAAELWGDETLVVFGGEGEGGDEGPSYTSLGDLWALNLTLAFEDPSSEEAAWELLHEGSDWQDLDTDSEAAVAPSGRFGMASAVSTVDSEDEKEEAGGMEALLVFGGWTLEWQEDSRRKGPNKVLSDELWAFDLGGELGWQQMPSWPAGSGPTARYGATGSFYDGSFLVLGGNSNSTEVFGELWSYSLTTQTWTALSSFSEPWLSRFGHGSAIVPGDIIDVGDNDLNWTDVLIFFGGSLDDTISEDPASNSAGAVELAAFGGGEGEGGETSYGSDGAGAGAGSSDGPAMLANLDLSPSLPRFGHSMVADSRGMLWVHGGSLVDAETLSDRTLVMYLGSEDVFDVESESAPSRRRDRQRGRQRQRRQRRRRRSLRAPALEPAGEEEEEEEEEEEAAGEASDLKSEASHGGGDDGFGSAPAAAPAAVATAAAAAPAAAARTTAGSVVSQRWARWGGMGRLQQQRRELASSSTAADDEGSDALDLDTTHVSRNWREYVPPAAGGDSGGESLSGPGARMHHGAVVWRGRMILHGGRLSATEGDASSSIWSLAIEEDDGWPVETGAGAGDDDDEDEDEGGGVASSFLVLAESDPVEPEQPPLAAVGWTASGVVVLVFVGAVVAWMLKHVLSCALHKLRMQEEGEDAESLRDSSESSRGGGGGPSGVFDAAGMDGFIGVAPVAPTTHVAANTGTSRRDGLSPSEIALLPVRRFVGPCPAPSTARESATSTPAKSSESGCSGSRAAAGEATTRAPYSGSGAEGSSPRRRSKSNGGRSELVVTLPGGEEEGGVEVGRPRPPPRKRLRQGMQSSSVSEATTTVSPSSSLSLALTVERSDENEEGSSSSSDGGGSSSSSSRTSSGSNGRETIDERVAEERCVENARGDGNGGGGGGGGGRSTDETCAICLTGYVENCSLRVLLPCEHVFHCSCVDEWLTRQGVCPICKCVVSVSGLSNSTIAGDDGGAPPRINRPRLAPIVPVDLPRAMAALMTPRAAAGVGVGGSVSGGSGGAGSRRSGTPQSLDTGHGTRTAMRAMTAATGGGTGGTGGGSGSGSSIGIDTRILHRVAVTATPTGSRSSSGRRRGGGGGGGGRSSASRNSTNRDARRMNRGFASAGAGISAAADDRRGRAGAGPRGAPALSTGGAVGGPRTRARGDQGRAVRVWESATGDDGSDDSGGDGGDERVVVTHYENPLFSHRTAVVGSREVQYR